MLFSDRFGLLLFRHVLFVVRDFVEFGGAAQNSNTSLYLPEYVRRLFQYPQMDMDYTLWQMLYLCVAPSRVYRTTKYHKQTKNQWARDGKFLVLSSPIPATVVA